MNKSSLTRTLSLITACFCASSALSGCAADKTEKESENLLVISGGSESEEASLPDSESSESKSSENGGSATADSAESEASKLPAEESSESEEGETAPLVSHTEDEMYTKRDLTTDYSLNDAVGITFDGAKAESSSPASASVYKTEVTITKEGTYVISGSSTDGTVIVDADKSAKLTLILSGLSLSSANSAPIYIKSADKVVLFIADGTENTLSNGGSFANVSTADESSVDAAVFSREDLSISGGGKLTVNSPAGHGIISKDDLVITGGDITVTSSRQGLGANDSVRIGGGNIGITSGKDGIHAENTDDTTLGFVYISGGNIKITSDGDGISASAYVELCGGETDITSGGGAKNAASTSDSFGGWFFGGREESSASDSAESTKGVKGQSGVLITGGSVTVNSADDSVHSNGDVTISGGTLKLTTGDDGVHADNSLTVKSGKIDITESYEGLEALNVDISGGEITLKASDDGINAAGGMDESGFGNFGGRGDRMDSGTGYSKSSEGMTSVGKSDYVSTLSASSVSVTKLADSDSSEQNRPNGRDYNSKERPPRGDRGDYGNRGEMGTPPDMQGGDFGGNFGGFGGHGGMGGSGNGSIKVSGGKIFIDASGDGIDANGTFEMTGGEMIISGPTRGDTATLDYDAGGTISGGTFIGMGASGMAQTFSGGTQGVITVSTSLQAGGEIKVEKDGKVLISHKAEQAAAVVILSSPEIIKGETYTLTLGDKSGEVEAK